jgi:hypothetical protein
MTDPQGAPAQQSAPSTNEPPDWYKNPPEWAKNPPANNPPANPPTNPGGQQRGYGQDILTTLQALPEQIVNAIREATPPPAESGKDDAGKDDAGKGETGKGETGKGEQNPGPQGVNDSRGDRFRKWWFG